MRTMRTRTSDRINRMWELVVCIPISLLPEYLYHFNNYIRVSKFTSFAWLFKYCEKQNLNV